MVQHRNIVGPSIRRLRNAKSISQERLSALCSLMGYEVSRSTLAKIEAQIRNVSDVEIFVLSASLGVEIRELYPPDMQTKLNLGIISPFHTRNNDG
jgi:transcriptional regulator with XRE-family HTH domain